MLLQRVLPIWLNLATAIAYAGGIESLTLSPVTVYVGDEVTITVGAGNDPPAYCGMALFYGDGSEPTNVKIDSAQQFPVQVRRVFQNPGRVSIKAAGLKVTTHLPCIGSAEAALTVIAKPPLPVLAPMMESSSEPTQPVSGLVAKPPRAVKQMPGSSRTKQKPVSQKPVRPVPKFLPIGGGKSAGDL